MKRFAILVLCFAGVYVISGPTPSVADTGFDELTHLMDSAQVLEADVFAPKAWKKASEKMLKAKRSINAGKNQKTINKDVSAAMEYVNTAINATEVAKLSLQEYLEPRNKARTAEAPVLVPELYGKAEKQFMKATMKVESGDVKGGLKEAEKSRGLFDHAEMEAIRRDILGNADKLIEKAVADDAGKYALSTLDKARTARQKADAILKNDRYNRTESIVEVRRAEYEARHASKIALAVRSLNRNDQAWEKLMLVYEIQMNRIGEAIGAEHLPFDNGPLAAADTLIHYISTLKADRKRMSRQMKDLSGELTTHLQKTLSRFDTAPSDTDPVALAEVIDHQVGTMIEQNQELQTRLQDEQKELAKLSAEHEQTSLQLASRMKREELFRKAKQMLNPSEGEVLFNSSNDIVLRLSGLSFDVGKATIKDEHVPLLEKVKEAIQMFPDAQLMVEGHTDASGDASTNMQLSEKRALAVVQYLRQSLLIPADRIRAVGYGSDRPIASNRTAEGRAKNRRIDIIIMQ